MSRSEPRLEELLGTMTDWELSQKTGIHVSIIFRMREELGIRVLNKTFFRATHRDRKIYWTQEMEAMLGTMSDREVAEELGVRRSTVRERRVELNIPTYPRKPRVKWTLEMELLLGTMPDQKIADMTGFSQPTVRRRRLQLDIPSFRPYRGGNK